MNVCGIVCEYNPFHTGHQYHIKQVRKKADVIICVMSGNYVQRGEPAIVRKHIRAKTAVACGADLVIELPTPWAISSAERFASGAIHLLTSFPELNQLSFGAEINDIELLEKTANLLESNEFSVKIKPFLNQGITFAAAREQAIFELEPECASVLREPNNILAVEYIKALRANKTISLLPVKRHKVEHDSEETNGSFSSASNLRNVWKNGCFDDILKYLPVSSYYFDEIKNDCAPVGISAFERMIPAVLKHMDANDFLQYPDVNEGLHFRLKEALERTTTLSEAIDYTKTKRYTHARIRRIFLNAFLGISSDVSKQLPPYLRILAFNDIGRSFLAETKATLPIITKPAHIKNLSDFSQAVFEREVLATNLYALGMPTPSSAYQEWNISPIYLPGKHKTV